MSIGKLPSDTNGNEYFGLTHKEYEFLQDDINQAIAGRNKKYCYGGYGYIDEDGNYYPFPDNYQSTYSNIPYCILLQEIEYVNTS